MLKKKWSYTYSEIQKFTCENTNLFKTFMLITNYIISIFEWKCNWKIDINFRKLL